MGIYSHLNTDLFLMYECMNSNTDHVYILILILGTLKEKSLALLLCTFI